MSLPNASTQIQRGTKDFSLKSNASQKDIKFPVARTRFAHTSLSIGYFQSYECWSLKCTPLYCNNSIIQVIRMFQKIFSVKVLKRIEEGELNQIRVQEWEIPNCSWRIKWDAYSRWSSSLYCPTRNSDKMTTGKTLATLYEVNIQLHDPIKG